MCDAKVTQMSTQAAMRREHWVAHFTHPRDSSDWQQDWAALTASVNQWRTMRPDIEIQYAPRVTASAARLKFRCCGTIPEAELKQLKTSLEGDGLVVGVGPDFIVYDPVIVRLDTRADGKKT